VLPSWQEILDLQVASNSVGAWLLAIGLFVVTFVVLPIVRGFITARRQRWARSGFEPPLAIEVGTRLVQHTSRLFLVTVALFLAVSALTLPPAFKRGIEIAIVVTFWLQVSLWAMTAVRFAIERRRTRDGAPDPQLAGSIQVILFIANLGIWVIAFLLALANLGIEIGPLLAGLGIGGIAVALAVQTVLGDLLASLSIALDKPFAVGDALQIDTFNGTVENIGVKSTRLRSISGEQIVMSNADILKSRVRNFGRMRERRVAMMLNVTYDTPADTLRAIPVAVREVVTAQANTRFDRCHFMAYAESALQFELVFIVTSADYGVYADVQQAVNLAILERFGTLGVRFALPTRRMVTD
jgi:small-conductance mechanosensitive channel